MSNVLTPEQAAALQQKGRITPQTAQAWQQKPALGQNPRLASAQMAGMVTPQTAYGQMAEPTPEMPVLAIARPAGEGKPSVTPMVDDRKKAAQAYFEGQHRQKRQQAQAQIDPWSGISQRAIRMGGAIGPTTQVPVKLSYLDPETRQRVSGQGGAALGWRLSDLDDDQYIELLRAVDRNLPKMSPEEQERAFGAFQEEAARRPELRKRLEAMMTEPEKTPPAPKKKEKKK